MNKWVAFFLGCAIGYGSSGYAKGPYWNQKVQIYGGVMTSSPVADVWGYDNDWEGCEILAGGANLINSKELEMPSDEWKQFVANWARKGSTSCRPN